MYAVGPSGDLIYKFGSHQRNFHTVHGWNGPCQSLFFPWQAHYKDDATLSRQFAGSGLHMAIVFPGLSGANDIDPESLAVGVAQATFMNYAFIIMADR